MPILCSDLPLGFRPRRVAVAGTSGSGKTTFASRFGAALSLPHTEIDALFHGPAWTPRPEFHSDVERLVAQESWITEWQYREARPLIARHADLLVWLDYPAGLVMRRVILRTVRRSLTRETLWNGNREPALWRFFTDRDHIIRWAWRTRLRTEENVLVCAAERPELTIVRLRHPREAEAWLSRNAAPAPAVNRQVVPGTR